MENFIKIIKALADESRLKIFFMIAERELCLCEIPKVMKLAPSTVSRHLSILKEAGLVSCRKDGKWHYYKMVDGRESEIVGKTLNWLKDCHQSVPELNKVYQSLQVSCGCGPESCG